MTCDEAEPVPRSRRMEGAPFFFAPRLQPPLVTCHSSPLLFYTAFSFYSQVNRRGQRRFAACDASGTLECRRVSLRARVEPLERLPDGAARRGRARRVRAARRGPGRRRAPPRAPLARESSACAQG